MDYHFNMKCTKCNITWAALDSFQDENRNEVYEVCPKCKSNMDLVECSDKPRFIRCPLSGKIKNFDTGELLTVETPSNYKPVKIKTWMEAWLEDEERQQRELLAIEHYHRVYEFEGSVAASRAFFEKSRELRSKEIFFNQRQAMIPDYE